MADYYVGTLSGTSADGIDAVLVDFAGETPRLIAARTAPMPDAVHREIRALAEPADDEIERLGRLDVMLGRLIAGAVNDLLTEAGVANREVVAIGSHGQTLRHRPDAEPPFTLQVGDPNTIAALTGITTVADFRRMDMALGGQGAPLAPLFHAAVFRRPGTDVAVLNIGGIANLTFLPGDPGREISGFDTGPGNCLMDEWILKNLGEHHDEEGAWAAGGKVIGEIVTGWLAEPYFRARAPKSTGREQFNLAWMRARADIDKHAARDVQASLVELTVSSIGEAIAQECPACEEVLVCGGGAYNAYLIERLAERLGDRRVASTSSRGIPPEWVEGCAFAYFASARMRGERLHPAAVTGATRDCQLGAVYPG